MARLRDKLYGLAEERLALEERLAMLKDGEARLWELGALPSIVEDYLADLPYLREVLGGLRYDWSPGSSLPERRSGHQLRCVILGLRDEGVMLWYESSSPSITSTPT